MQVNLQNVQKRARLFKQIRAFFDALNYSQVDTPLLSGSTNTDIHIQSIQALACNQRCYLQTSPEFSMKRLLVAGSGSIYQICPAFRDEEKGRFHQSEFTLLEWYSLGFDYQALMRQVETLINSLIEFEQQFSRISYFECFDKYLNVNLWSSSLEELQQCVTKNIPGIDHEQLSRDDCLDLLMSQVVAKQFKDFTFVYDYPATQASLAKIKNDNPLVAERFELFFKDLELANGFTELTDASEQRQRFLTDNQKRLSLGLEEYPVDEDFLSALEQGMPECAGVALGLERLLMVMTKAEKIADVAIFNS